MTTNKVTILNNVCYTALVYGRINKKLQLQLTNAEIEKMMLTLLTETPEQNYQQKGKNTYVTHTKKAIKITINNSTKRIITVDKIKKQ